MTLTSTLIRDFLQRHPGESVPILERHDVATASEVLLALPDAAVAAALNSLSPGFSAAIFRRWGEARIASVLTLVTPLGCARLLRRLDDELRDGVLNLLPEKLRRRVGTILEYQPDTAGGRMDPNPPVVREEDRVDVAVRKIRESEPSTMPYVYVLDRDHRLVGVLTASRLLHLPPDDLIRDWMTRVTESIAPRASVQEILQHPGWWSYRALPVVDRMNRLIGVVRYESYLALVSSDAGGGASPTSTAELLGDLFYTSFSGILEAATRTGGEAGRWSTRTPDAASSVERKEERNS